MPVQMSEFYYPSSDGKSQIHAMLWQPTVASEAKGEPEASAGKARGLIQLVHGVNEYIGRYDPLARFLAEQGFVVFGEDHLGHGKSGNFAQTPQGADVFIPRDSIQLALLMKARFAPAPGEKALPFILFGHSLGSAIARIMAAEKALELAGLILCGTVHVPSFGRLLLPHDRKNSGNTKIVGNSIPLSWLSFDREKSRSLRRRSFDQPQSGQRSERNDPQHCYASLPQRLGRSNRCESSCFRDLGKTRSFRPFRLCSEALPQGSGKARLPAAQA